ncbi:Palmitoyltransferase [Coemansia sp. Benny D115]|nr:Palmitoyltransferase [Coemansia sp. Benny D115]
MSDGEIAAEFDVGRIYVGGVSLLIGFIGYSSQVFVFWEYLGGYSLRALVVLGAFNFMLHLLYYNYYLAVTVSPGHVPLGWEPPRMGANVYELKRDTHKPRYCRQCRNFKPPRAHHCSECGRCVLKMDHHCPWTNNCVGFNNQGHFLRFVYMVDATCAFAIALHSMRLWELVADSLNGTYYVRQPTQSEVAFLIINLTLAGIVLLFVGVLSGYHAYLVSSNTTTIESREKARVEKLVQARKCPPAVYPYDLGIVRNLRSVFGERMIWWWVPKPMSGDGLDFAIGSDLVPPVYWPPVGYTRESGDGEQPRTLYKAKDSGTRVVAEIDADGEMVIRQYNKTADPASLEAGGLEEGETRRAFDSGRDENDESKSEAGDFDSDEFASDSDDELCDAQPSYAQSSAVATGVNRYAGESTMHRRSVFAADGSAGASRSNYAQRFAATGEQSGSESGSDNEPLLNKARRRSAVAQMNR